MNATNMTPRTDSQVTEGDRMAGVSVVSAVFARQLENELNVCREAIIMAIANILMHGGHEEWPIVKHLRAAMNGRALEETTEPQEASARLPNIRI